MRGKFLPILAVLLFLPAIASAQDAGSIWDRDRDRGLQEWLEKLENRTNRLDEVAEKLRDADSRLLQRLAEIRKANEELAESQRKLRDILDNLRQENAERSRLLDELRRRAEEREARWEKRWERIEAMVDRMQEGLGFLPRLTALLWALTAFSAVVLLGAVYFGWRRL